ncbi:MAG TPA: DUF4263 domain-containing protein [Colwellia sp.]|nr:DUF4263 domain-containing protein [Colwellia sp.]|tara:strand:- start:1633 stop:3033 length:1401 start_codon:yes stop_codon:yes gene_type:complete
MARLFPNNISQRPEGTLLIEESHEGNNEIYYVPHHDMLALSKKSAKSPGLHKTLLLNVNITQNYLEILPITTLGSSPGFLNQKYSKLKSIVLESFDFEFPNNSEEITYLLEELPSGFVKDPDYGLGLLKELKPLITTLEEFGVEILIIKNMKLEKSEIDASAKTCIMSYAQFETIRKELAKVVSNAQKASLSIRKTVANNTLSFFLDHKDYPQKTLKIQNTALARLVGKGIEEIESDLSKPDQSLTLSLIEKNAKKIANDQPAKLLKLRDDIELVTLEQLIEKYEKMLDKRHSEGHWQSLFNENPFILSMAFSCPIIKVQGQASVGGRKISGSGDKITDFLVKNAITNNTAIIEIKTPQELLTGKEYRDSVYAPSVALSGSITQILDQKYKLQKSIATIKEASRIYDVETYSVHCVLIIGTMPDDLEKQKSIDIFRRNSRDVEVITFDELLEKLKLLHRLLSTNEV